MRLLRRFTLKPIRSSEVNIASLAVLALLIFIPLYPKFPLFTPPKTYVAIRAEDILVAFVLLIWAFFQLKKSFFIFWERISWLILLYWFVGFLSLISALLITKTVVPHLAFLHFLRRIEYMSLFFVTLSSIWEKRNIFTPLLTLFLATVGVVLYGLGQKFLGWPVISTMSKEFSQGLLGRLNVWTRVNSTFAGHYDLAAYTVLILALTWAFLVWEKNFWRKFLIGLFLILVLYLLVLTASRVSFVAYLIALIFTLVLLKKKSWLPIALFLSLSFIFLSGELTERYLVTVSSFRLSSPSKKIEVDDEKKKKEKKAVSPVMPTSLSPKKKKEKKPSLSFALSTPTPGPPEPVRLATRRSTEIRFKIEWPRAVRAFLKNPFLGTGYSSITLATDNDYLRLLGETGLLGFISFNLIFLELFRKSLFFLKKTSFCFEKVVVVGILGGIIGMLVNALFIDVFEASKIAFVVWILFGILVGTINFKEKAVVEGFKER